MGVLEVGQYNGIIQAGFRATPVAMFAKFSHVATNVRHLYNSRGRPSCWALPQILIMSYFPSVHWHHWWGDKKGIRPVIIFFSNVQKFAFKQSTQVQYNYNTTAIQEFFSCIAVVLHLCGCLQYNTTIQIFYNLQKTCRLLAAVVKKLVLQLYCACVDWCNTTKFLFYSIVVVL